MQGLWLYRWLNLRNHFPRLPFWSMVPLLQHCLTRHSLLRHIFKRKFSQMNLWIAHQWPVILIKDLALKTPLLLLKCKMWSVSLSSRGTNVFNNYSDFVHTQLVCNFACVQAAFLTKMHTFASFYPNLWIFTLEKAWMLYCLEMYSVQQIRLLLNSLSLKFLRHRQGAAEQFARI